MSFQTYNLLLWKKKDYMFKSVGIRLLFIYILIYMYILIIIFVFYFYEQSP